MRSLLLALGVGILALNFAGCSCTMSSSCSGVSTGNAMTGDCGPTCTSCDSGCDTGCDSCAGTGFQRPMLMQRLKSKVSSMGAADCGCQTGGDCGCGVGSRLGSRLASLPAPSMGGCESGNCGDAGCGCGGRSGLGLGLFEAGPDCQVAGGCADGGCDGRCGGGAVRAGLSDLAGRVRGRIGCGIGGCGLGGNLCSRCGDGMMGHGQLLSKVKGCGRFGCGFGGKLCGKCGSGTGTIPHREPQGPGVGQVPSYVYPYYTTRAPRDFLMANPPTIGY